MSTEFALLPSRRTIRWLDAVSILTGVVFLTLGLVLGSQLWNLAQLHRGLLDAAAALDTTARAINTIGGAPFIGDSARGLAADITAAAQNVRASAVQARDALGAVALGVGAVVALLGLLPVVLLYLPLRLARRRELRGLRRELAAPADPMLVEHLARAAVRRLPYAELRRVSPHPWRDLERGHHGPLAAAELRRLGLAGELVPARRGEAGGCG